MNQLMVEMGDKREVVDHGRVMVRKPPRSDNLIRHIRLQRVTLLKLNNSCKRVIRK
jgi:hypothetical protein